jgi:hypothetical protein
MTTQIERLTDAVAKGVAGIGLDRMLSPAAVDKARGAVLGGDASQITEILLEVAGDSISLTAGKSAGGARAVKALAEAMGTALFNIREQRQPAGAGAASTLQLWRDALVDWAISGIATGDSGQSDLSLIGGLIGHPTGRDHAAASFLSAIAVCQHVLRDQ